jgi:hypothetical protein
MTAYYRVAKWRHDNIKTWHFLYPPIVTISWEENSPFSNYQISKFANSPMFAKILLNGIATTHCRYLGEPGIIKGQ